MELGAFFVKVGAFTFGGGLSILAFIEDALQGRDLHGIGGRVFDL